MHPRYSRYVTVSDSDYQQYHHAVGRRRTELHLLIFYERGTQPLGADALRLEHPILVGNLPADHVEARA